MAVDYSLLAFISLCMFILRHVWFHLGQDRNGNTHRGSLQPHYFIIAIEVVSIPTIFKRPFSNAPYSISLIHPLILLIN